MLDADETYALNYAVGEDYDMDLNMKKTRMMPLHSCQTTRDGTSHVINHDKVLTTKQADFVNKELNTSRGTMSIKNCNSRQVSQY